MKTTHKKAVDAYIVLVKMSDIRRAPATQIKLFKLKKLLQTPFEFVSEEEKKLYGYLHERDKENGTNVAAEYSRSINARINQETKNKEIENITDDGG